MSKDPLSDPIDLGLVEAAAEAPPPKTGDELRKEDFIKQLIAARTVREPEPIPAPQTPRQLDQTKREMAKGADRVQYSKEQELKRPPRPAPDPREGTVTPVFRPSDYQHETKGAVPFKG